MNTSDSRDSGSGVYATHRMPTPEGLLLLLKNTAIRQQLLSHPLVAETLLCEAVKRSGLRCSDVEERLAALIDAEVSETSALGVHEGTSLHIHMCPWCYDIYAVTHEILAAQKDGILPPWPS